MSREIIVGNGKIFRETAHGDWDEVNGNLRLTSKQIKAYENYTGVKAESIRDSLKSHPKWTQLMIDHNRKNY